jgi:hypothetical protein
MTDTTDTTELADTSDASDTTDGTASTAPTGGGAATRAQLLATEHWGLLASRGATQSEMLSRISMFLTLISAGLVSIALVGQASSFGPVFGIFSVIVLALIAIVGFLTQLRVVGVGMEDLMYVLAMNRLRGAYTDLDPGVGPYLMASPHDDRAGSRLTYDFLGVESDFRHVGGSSFVLIMVLESAIVGLFAGSVLHVTTGVLALTITVGVLACVVYFAVSAWQSGRQYGGFWQRYEPLKRSPGAV